MDTRTEQVLTAFDMLKDRIDDIDCRQNRGITLLTLAITLAALVIGAIQVWLATRGEAMNIRERLSGGGAQYIPLSFGTEAHEARRGRPPNDSQGNSRSSAGTSAVNYCSELLRS